MTAIDKLASLAAQGGWTLEFPTAPGLYEVLGPVGLTVGQVNVAGGALFVYGNECGKRIDNMDDCTLYRRLLGVTEAYHSQLVSAINAVWDERFG